ncbi:MAG: ABC transporter ATP-binding protein [Desulfomonile tiedjei]|nr:ABC transporter ATP-binding protein [Desulfomonile tiedjei]
MHPLIRLENVTKRYPSGMSRAVVPLKEVSLEIHQGERILLLGKSGSGKSTFLNILGGVDLPTSGRVLYDGREISTLPQQELALYRRKEVGFVFQSFNLFPTLTVGENLTLPLDLLGITDETKAREVLEAVGLASHWDKFPEQLSGGEQQRVAIARALVKGPKLILADEPTGNLDLETGNSVLELIHEICSRTDATLVMATHSAEALWLAHRKYRLRGGKLVEESESGEVI